MNNDRKIYINYGLSYRSNEMTQHNITWSEIVNTFRNIRDINCSIEHLEALYETKESNDPNIKAEDKAKAKEEINRLKDTGYFILGAFKFDTKNKVIRLKDNQLSSEGLVYDGDDFNLEDLSKIREILKTINYNYMIFTTARYNGKNGRCRLVIPFDKPIDPKNYKGIASVFAKTFFKGFKFDTASLESYHAMNKPARTKNISPIFEAETSKDYLVASELIKQAKNEPKEDKPYNDIPLVNNSPVVKYEPKRAIELAKAYIEKNRDNLQDREKFFLPALMSIVKGVQTGELDMLLGEHLAMLLADGNSSWEEDNIRQFNYEVNRTVIRTEYNFSDRFDPLKSLDSVINVEDDIICFADVEIKEVEWLWEDYIPLGMIFGVQGDPGSGKTFAMLKLCADITNGKLPPNKYGFEGITKPSNVLIVNGEDSLNYTIAARVRDSGADLKKVFTMNIQDKALDFSQIERIEKVIQKIKPKIVLFDPIQNFLGADVDMNKANETRPVMSRIARLAEKYMFACGFIGHMNKYGGGKAQYRGLGSIDFSAIYRAQFLVGEDRRTPGHRLIVPIKASLSPKAYAQGFKIADSKNVEWTGPSITANEQDILKGPDELGDKEQEATDWLMEKLEERPYWSTELEELADAEGIANRTLVRARLKLKDNWKITNGRAPGLKKWYWAMNHRDIDFLPNGQLGYIGKDEQVGQT